MKYEIAPYRSIKTLLLSTLLFIAYSTAAANAADVQQDVEASADQSQGELQEDGSITPFQRPNDITHPDRWRYIPPEKIVSGNLFERFLISSFIAPIVFRDSDVGTGGGVTVTDIDFREQRRKEFAGMFFTYTTEGQQRYSFIWRRWLEHRDLPNDGVLLEERNWLTLRGGYTRTLTKRFFGLGDNTEENDETSYTEESFALGLELQKSLPDTADDFVLRTGVSAQSHRLFDGEVSDVPTTEESFPTLFEEADSRDQLWLSFGLRWDTRDSQVNPYRGWALGVDSSHAVIQNGSGYGGVYGAYGTIVLPVPPLFYETSAVKEENPPTDTIGLILESHTSAGELPFFSLPTLGGSDRQRGYLTNRWTADSTWFSAIEHRFWVMPRGFPITERIRIERLGFATFYEIGGVADTFAGLVDSSIIQSYGIGLRFTLERNAPFRVDLGFSEEDTELIARFGLSY